MGVRLEWDGKDAAWRTARELLAVRPDEAPRLVEVAGESLPGAGGAPSAHLVVEADNLDALQALRVEHAGRVRLVYLDPPYNTGSELPYADRLDPEAWLTMMLPRLVLARELLTDDGVCCVSIDDHQLARLRLVAEEVFGAANVLATLVWVSNLKGRQLRAGGPAGTHEYVLCLARDARAVPRFRLRVDELRALMPAVYRGAEYPLKHDERGPYVTKNGLHNTNSRFNERTAPTLVYRIHWHPATGEVRVADIDDEQAPEGFATALPHPSSRPGLRWHAWRWSRAKVLAEHAELEFEVDDGGRLRIRTKVRDVDGVTLKDIVLGPTTLTGLADLAALGLGRTFDAPKPVALLEVLVGAITGPDDTVVDLFAGSGTTGEAVWRRNRRDGGRRRFVLVQHDEAFPPGSVAREHGWERIAELTRERLRRASAALHEADAAGSAPDAADPPDRGFRSMRVAPLS